VYSCRDLAESKEECLAFVVLLFRPDLIVQSEVVVEVKSV